MIMQEKTKKILLYVGAGLLVAAMIVLGIVEIAGGAEPEPVDSVLTVVDTLQAVVADTVEVVADTVVAQ